MTELLERIFGLDVAMARAARYRLQGIVNAPEEVVGRFLLLLADTGYLRSDRRSEHLRFYRPDNPPLPLAFQNRSDRWRAWAGLLQQGLRRDGNRLVGEGGPLELLPVTLSDRPTPAQVTAVAQLARRRGLEVDLERLTFSEAGRILAAARGRRTDRSEGP